MRRTTQLTNDHYYHIFNRGVEKRNIFLDNADYWRLIQGLYDFNSDEKITNRHLKRKLNGQPNGQPPRLTKRLTQLTQKPVKQIVSILCYCLMPNHFHILLKQQTNDGISKFIQRLAAGYTKYFNKRYERAGHLFEGPFKAKLIDNDSYFLHLSRYIHLNPLKIFLPNYWQKEGIKDWKQANKFLENYRWSSYSTYLGLNNFSLVNKDLLGKIFKTPEKYKQFVNEWLPNDLENIKQFL